MLWVGQSMAAIHGQTVVYEGDGIKMQGYMAYDDSIKGKRPGVLVVHEWWGHNDYARKRARMLAKLGYTAFALDMYGKGKQASHPKEANAMSKAIFSNLEGAKKRFLAARRLLAKHPTVNGQIAAIGYCFGGGVALHMARMGVPLRAVVSFHGSLSTQMPAKKGQLKAKILVLTGAADPFNKPAQVAGFKKEMDAAGADYKVISYAGAKHAFTNPDADSYGKKYNIPLAYNKEADEKSWAAMQELFKSVFK